MRPANIVTAIADILAGFAISSVAVAIVPAELLWLCLATIGLYGGGITFNDVFDAKLDRTERPERPIPSGRASLLSASLLGGGLLLLGLFAAAQVGALSLYLAIAIALLALFYDAFGKHQELFGPVNMGLCRGGNLLLGMSAVPATVGQWWFLALIPVAYIAAITMISRGEVHGGSKTALRGGMGIYGFIIALLLGLTTFTQPYLWELAPFVAYLAYRIFPPLLAALRKPEPPLIGKAVKAGILSLIVLNAALAAGFAGWVAGFVILLLLPVSLWLARLFTVT